MSENLMELKAKAIALPPEQRADLAHDLLVSLHDEVEEGVESAWKVEIQRRVAEIRSGKAAGRNAADVLAEIRARFS